MDEFPAGFDSATYAKLIGAKGVRDEEENVQREKEARKRLFDFIDGTFKKHEQAFLLVIPLDEGPTNFKDYLSDLSKKKLIAELCKRFPNCVYKRRVIEYADVDEFRLIKDPMDDGLSFEYAICFGNLGQVKAPEVLSPPRRN